MVKSVGLPKSLPKPKATTLHPRNPHQGRYDFEALCKSQPLLKPFVIENAYGDQTIDFANPDAVLALNQSLLALFYQVKLWQIPPGYLCPPIPGRADYIHYLADLLAADNEGEVPTGKQVRVLDIGCGANCIYPIIGSQAYGWKFVGSDIDPVSVKCAQAIVSSNSSLAKHIKLVLQKDADAIFKGVIKSNEYYQLTLCNPPFHASMAEANNSNQRKQKNLQHNRLKRKGHSPYNTNIVVKDNSKQALNFGGQGAELWCPGGEMHFLTRMARESVVFREQVNWFSTLVSKKENVKELTHILNKIGAAQIEVVNMAQGQKVSRLIAWKF